MRPITGQTVPTNWRKSSRSSTQTNCIEVGRIGDGAAVRDTKNRGLGHLATTRRQWHTFLAAVKAARFSD